MDKNFFFYCLNLSKDYQWTSKAKIDLKMINDENDVLTDNDLIVAKTSLKNRNMHSYIYKMNFLVGLGW